MTSRTCFYFGNSWLLWQEKISLREEKEKGEKEDIVAKFLFLLDQSELAVFYYRAIFKFSQDSLKALLDNI